MLAFLRSAYGKIFFICFLVGGLFYSVALHREWVNLHDDYIDEMIAVQQIVKKTSNDQFLQTEVLLRLTAERLAKTDNAEFNRTGLSIMNEGIFNNPAFIGSAVISEIGEWVLRSSELKKLPLSNVISLPKLESARQKGLETGRMVIGNTFYLNALDAWVIPLVISIPDSLQRREWSLVTFMNIDEPSNPWRSEHVDSDFNIYATSGVDDKGDYFPLYYYPLINYSSKAETYSKALPRPFVHTAATAVEAATGMTFEAFKKSGEVTHYINDTSGLDPALVVLSYNNRYDYLLGVRVLLPTMNMSIITPIIGITLVFFCFMAAAGLGLYRFFQTELRSEYDLKFKLMHDESTGLLNRLGLSNKLESYSGASVGKGLLLLNAVNFGRINEQFGYAYGDRVLRRIAQRLEHLVGGVGLLARVGGDEFVLVFDLENEDQLNQLANKILGISRNPIRLNSSEIVISCNLGGVSSTASDFSLENLLSKARMALQEAIDRKIDYAVFSPSISERYDFRNAISHALSSPELERQMYVVYQPQVNTDGLNLHGAEILVRWESAELGTVSPQDFIPVAESSGYINKIGDLVIQKAMEELSASGLDLSTLQFSINVSARQLGDSEFRSKLLKQVMKHRINPSNITLEITESTLLEQYEETIVLLHELREDGFGLSLDDFGTGYASLTYLRDLPLTEIKIDKTFVDNILYSESDNALIKGIIGVSRSQRIPIVAEGVETIEQVNLLTNIGCDLLQGYYFAKPMRFADFKEYVEKE